MRNNIVNSRAFLSWALGWEDSATTPYVNDLKKRYLTLPSCNIKVILRLEKHLHNAV